jgi:hypothetical protein
MRGVRPVSVRSCAFNIQAVFVPTCHRGVDPSANARTANCLHLAVQTRGVSGAAINATSMSCAVRPARRAYLTGPAALIGKSFRRAMLLIAGLTL